MPDDNPQFSVSSLLQWPTALFEEILLLPESLRDVRELLHQQVRLLRQLNDASEILVGMARRWEGS